MEKQVMDLKIGDRVRVKDSLVVYHHPKHRNQPFDLQGNEGEVIKFASQHIHNGEEVDISANFPIVVQFPDLGKRFRVHLRVEELESVS